VENDVGVLDMLKHFQLPIMPSAEEMNLPESISRRLWALCQKCWNILPEERPPMRIVAKDVEETLNTIDGNN